MIAAWMGYALAIAALIAVAALAAEQALRIARRQTRWVWAAALVGSVVLPLIAPRLQIAATTATERQHRELLAALGQPARMGTTALPWTASSAPIVTSSPSLSDWLLIAWAASSLTLACAVGLSRWHLHQRLRHSRSMTLAGTSVFVTDNVGPAVVGLITPRIYVPSWLLDADAATQAMVMEHEREHVRGLDPQLLAAALLLLVLLPWNLPLWWQLRRLRFAIEVDCDARVLSGGRDAKTYGAVMLNAATHSSSPVLVAASLSEPASFLERRIRIMMATRKKHWLLSAALLFGGSMSLLTVAATVDAPPTGASPKAHGDSLPLIPSPMAVANSEEDKLVAAVRHLYPQLAQVRQAGSPYVWVLVNRNGEVSRSELELRPFDLIRRTDHDNREAFAKRFGTNDEPTSSYSARLQPGQVGPDRVTVSWMVRADAPVLDPSAPRFPLQSPAPIGDTVLARLAAERAVIEHFDAAAIDRGLAADQELWFLMNADGKVLEAGRRARITDPELARADLQTRFPGTRVSYVTQGTGVKDRSNRRLAVSWEWLASDSPLP
jgi:beta-lactamase regulating signal transducer with metallopeptidase domain